MSLLSRLRSGTNSTAFKALFFVVVIVFVFWGVGANQMATTQTYATVGGQRITSTDFNRAMRRLNLERTVTADEMEAQQRVVMRQLIQREVLLQEARQLDLEVSNKEVDRTLEGIDAFKDDEGAFSKTLYERLVRQQGMTLPAFEQSLREELLIGKLTALISAGVVVTDAEVAQAWTDFRTQVTARQVLLTNEAVRRTMTADPVEVEALIAADKARIETRYQADLDRLYTVPAKADISTILLRRDIEGATPEELKKRLAGLRETLTEDPAQFEELARTWSEDLSATTGGRLGEVALPQLDPAITAAIEATDAGALSDIIETGRGVQLAMVHTKTEGSTTPYEEVERSIAETLLKEDKTEEAAGDLAQQLHATWVATGSPDPALLATAGVQARLVGPQAPLQFGPGLDTVLGLAEPGVLEPVRTPQGWAIVEVISVSRPGDDPTADLQKQMLAQQLEQQREQALFEAWIQSRVAQAQVVQNFP